MAIDNLKSMGEYPTSVVAGGATSGGNGNGRKGVDLARHDEIEDARRLALPDPARVNTFRQYARGRQRDTVMSPEQKRVLQGMLSSGFCENVLARVLAVICDRIHVTGYQVANAEVEAFAKEVWVKNWLPSLYAQTVYSTWRDGNSAIGLAWHGNKSRPITCREKWWNGKSGIWFAYDDQGEPLYAVKEWSTPEGKRRTVYYAHEIRRYIQRSNGWEWIPNDEGKTGPIEWLARDGSPLGIAAVHLARLTEPPDAPEGSKDNGGDSNYGISLYDGGLVPLQDGVNDQHKNLFSAARFTAYQIITGSGVEPEIDPRTKQPKPIKIQPGTALTSKAAEARWGFIPAGSIKELMSELDNLIRAISAQARVPEHLIKGQWPSGEALFRAEMPLIDTARKGASVLGPAFASVMHKCVLMSNTFALTSYDTDALITTMFAPPERYDPLTLTQLAVERAEYVSLKEVWRLMGYDAEKQAQLEREMREEASFRPPATPPGSGFDNVNSDTSSTQ